MNIDLDLLLAPLAGEPSGSDPNLSAEFDALSEELAKLEGIDRMPVNWKLVADLAEQILREQSKDLRVAAYLSYAWYELHKEAGLAQGLGLFAGLCNAEYWETIYPRRKKRQGKARASAFLWLSSRLDKVLESLEVNENSPLDDVIAIVEQFDNIDNALVQRLEDDAPNVIESKNLLRRYKLEAETWKAELAARAEKELQAQQQKEAEQTSSPSEPESTPTQQSAAPEPAPQHAETASQPALPAAPAKPIAAQGMGTVSAAEVDKALAVTGKTLDAIVKALDEAAPGNADSFYYARMAKWGQLRDLPPNNAMPPMPDDNAMSALAELEAAGNWEALIQQAENYYRSGAIFTMALHRMISNALIASGREEASDLVKNCVKQVLIRIPDFTTRTFEGGRKFVDDITQAWIDTELSTGGGDGGGQSAAEPWVQAGMTAKSALAKGNFEEGVAVFTQGANAAMSKREETCWLLALAEYCLQAGHEDVAFHQLEYLLDLTEHPAIKEWEKPLRQKIIRLILDIHNKRTQAQPYTDEQSEMLAGLKKELFIYDPLAGVQLAGLTQR